MPPSLRRLLLILPLWLLAACAATPPATPADSDAPRHSLYVMAGGWHTNITVDAAAIRPWLDPALQRDFPRARYLRFGWGDGDYYPARAPTRAMAVRALFASRHPVMRVMGSGGAPALENTPWETVAVGIDDAGLRSLAAFINASLAGDRRRAPDTDFQPDINAYYLASGRYGAFNTCNTWTLRGLQAAGLPVNSTLRLTREAVMAQLRPLHRPPAPGLAPVADRLPY